LGLLPFALGHAMRYVSLRRVLITWRIPYPQHELQTTNPALQFVNQQLHPHFTWCFAR